MALIYKIAPRALWQAAEIEGRFGGAAVDLADGYIHFSSADQVGETAARHFAGQDDLLIAAVEADDLGDALRWETSRGDALFPHLYAPLSMDVVKWVRKLRLREDGSHEFPNLAA